MHLLINLRWQTLTLNGKGVTAVLVGVLKRMLNAPWGTPLQKV